MSRGIVRTSAPQRLHGFVGMSPFTRPRVVAVAEAIPFDELTRGSVERLYELKGEVLRRGVERVLGMEMPIFPKRRFQHGATSEEVLAERFAVDPELYRRHLYAHFASRRVAS
jgi:asparagine synthase (glutamine-hydrolysing)